jgi:phospholipid transport system substrate-binding protein
MRVLSLAVILLLTAFLAPAAKAQAPDPAVQPVQTFCDTLLNSMKHAKELGIKGRYDKLKPVTDQLFGFPVMVRFIVGSDKWDAISSADRQSLVAAFARFTAVSWASNFDGYDGEKLVVNPATQARAQDRVVMTDLVARKETVSIGYRMRLIDGSWRVVDVYFKNTTSQLSTLRSEYAATFSSGGAPALVKKLNAKSDELMAGG